MIIKHLQMKGNKRFLFVLLAFAAGLTSAYAYDFEADGLYYNINSGTTTVTVTFPGSSLGSAWTNFTKPIGELVIPSTVTYNETEYTVTVIGAHAFRMCSGLTSVTLPTSLTKIDQYAFYNCTSMGNISIPSSVETIGKYAFKQCNAFTTITIPNTVTSLEDHAFDGCHNVTTLTIGTGITVLKANVFDYMENITTVNIPANITEINANAFSHCYKLATITGGANVETIGKAAFSDCRLLASASFANVVTIVDFAFDNCKVLASVSFPKVETLGAQVFNQCDALTSISLPNTLNSVSGSIFSNCTGSVSITVAEGGAYKNDENNSCILTADGTTLVSGCNNTVIPSGITTISQKAFYKVTGITEATIPASVTSIGNSAFDQATGLTRVTMESSNPCSLGTNVFKIGGLLGATILPNLIGIYVPDGTANAYKTATNWIDYADYIHEVTENIVFADDAVRVICVDNNWDTNHDNQISYAEAAAVTNIGAAFKNNTTITSFNEFQYFTGVTELPASAFYNCSSLTSIIIPSSVTTFKNSVFQNSGLTSVVIPNSVTTVGTQSFIDCKSLASVTIGSGLTQLGQNMFKGCIALESITLPGTLKKTGLTAFKGCTNLSSVTIQNGVEEILSSTFSECPALTSISFPKSVTAISGKAFSNCEALASFTVSSSNAKYYVAGNAIIEKGTKVLAVGCNATVIPDDVVAIGDGAFYTRKNLTAITIPASVKSIGREAFEATGLTTVDLSGVTDLIDYHAFYNCKSLTSVVLPATITSMGNGVFASTTLASVTIPDGWTNISDYTFRDCTSLTSVTLGSGLQTIGQYAFNKCNHLTTITIPSNVTTIGNYAFTNCNSLETVFVNATTPPTLASNYMFYNGSSSTSTIIPSLTAIYVPAASVSAYKNDNGAKANGHWSTYESIIKGWMQKSVAGYGSGNEAVSDHWCLIASPIVAEEGIDPASVGNLTTGNFDLYRLNEGGVVMQEWENYENAAHTDDFKIENGQGYLYANEDDVELTFFGDFNTETTKEVTLHKTEGSKIPGWNLVGNPFTVDAYIGRSHYVLNDEGSELEPATSGNNAIAPLSGILVQADNDGDILTFSTTQPTESAVQGNFSIALSQQLSERGASVIDNAIVSFDERNRLGKFALNNNRAKVYIPQNGKDYAIAVATRESELPLNFKATENGTYTLSFSANGVEMGYFHLIDNMTGANIDLNVTPSYTFTAKTTDYASRFRIVFKTNDIEESGDTTSTASFAFIDAAGNIVVTEATQDATLQIVDLTGRIIRIANGIDTVSTTGMPAGVYVLRLINGNDVKTQKMVIE